MAAIYDVNSHASIGDFYAKCHKLGMHYADVVMDGCPAGMFRFHSIDIQLCERSAWVSVTLDCDYRDAESSFYQVETVDGFKVTVNVITCDHKGRRAELDARLSANKA